MKIRISLIIVVLLVVHCLASSPIPVQKECGTRTVSDEEKRNFAAAEKDYLERNPSSLADRQGIKYVAINWHHIYYGTPYLDTRSLDILLNFTNDHFRDTGTQFFFGSLDSFDAQLNNKPNWWNLVVYSSDDYEMRSALKIGNNRNLNIYLCNLYQWGGYSAFPQDYQNNPVMDGIALLYNQLPQFANGDASYIYVLNMLFVHEVGHWMGLYHTFEGGCSDDFGDYVLDTPAEAQPAYDCPTNPPLDTCPNLPGVDPVYNIMDYASWCRNEFTTGQVGRMITMFGIYRNDDIVYTQPALTTGYSPIVTTSSSSCVGMNGYMRCTSSTQFQTCSNGVWMNPIPCALNTYCTTNGNYIYCSYTNPTTTSNTATTTTTTTTSTTAPLTTHSLTTQPLTTRAVAPLTTQSAPQPFTTRPLTTASSSTSCTVGDTRCNGQSTYQTCVWTFSSGGYVGGWGSTQSCAAGTKCTQYSTYIGCTN